MLGMEEEGAENVDEAAGSLAPPTAMTPSREGGSRTTGACMGSHVRGGSCLLRLPMDCYVDNDDDFLEMSMLPLGSLSGYTVQTAGRQPHQSYGVHMSQSIWSTFGCAAPHRSPPHERCSRLVRHWLQRVLAGKLAPRRA